MLFRSLHVPIHSMLRRIVPATGPVSPPSTGFLVAYLLLSVLIAILVLKLLEEPARLALRRRLVKWMATGRDRAPQGGAENVPATS